MDEWLANMIPGTVIPTQKNHHQWMDFRKSMGKSMVFLEKSSVVILGILSPPNPRYVEVSEVMGDP